MPGSRIRPRPEGRTLLGAPQRFVAAVPAVLATASLLGLRGVGRFELSPAICFALGVAALITAGRLRRGGREFPQLWEIGLALAIAACGAAAFAALVTGHS